MFGSLGSQPIPLSMGPVIPLRTIPPSVAAHLPPLPSLEAGAALPVPWQHKRLGIQTSRLPDSAGIFLLSDRVRLPGNGYQHSVGLLMSRLAAERLSVLCPPVS